LTTMPTTGPAETLLDLISARTRALVEEYPAAGIGVAVAGFVDDARSAMIYNPNLEWLEGFPIRSAMETQHGMAVALDADSNAACLAEHRLGVGNGAGRFLCLAIGTGVGGGMIVGGEVVRLSHGGLGDIGHVMVEPFGLPCGSGCHGCAEALITTSGIEARWGGGSPKTAREIIEAAQAGDSRAISTVAETGRMLGIALASQMVILFPDAVAIAGGIAEAGELLLAPARAAVESLIGPFYRRGVRIEKAQLGWQAPLVGAAIPLLAH